MASVLRSLGGAPATFPLVCRRNLDLGTLCLHRSVVDTVNRFFLCCFYFSLVYAALNKKKHGGRMARGRLPWWPICCAGVDQPGRIRSLGCIGRFLRRNRTLVLDKLTASIDSLVFEDCIVVTIARGVHTVIDSDTVPVMSHGKPYNDLAFPALHPRGKEAMARKVSRNPDLIRGIGKYSRSQMYHKRGLWAIKAKNGGVLPRHDPKPKPAAVSEKLPKYYPADDIKKPLVNKHKPRPTKLRASITPGTVLIILAGRFKGKRVVFLKQLLSGLLLITGPFKINGVPLRRVNQSYVIATSTKVDISGVNVEKFDDKYFSKEVEKKKKKTEGEFFEAEKEEKNTLPEVKKEDQKSVDAVLIKSIESVPDLKTYIGARFSLKAGMKPHELVF